MTSVNIHQVLGSGELTMTSLEVAELIKIRHDNVLRKIRELSVKIRTLERQIDRSACDNNGSLYWIQHIQSGGRPIQNYVMTRDLWLLLLTELKAPLSVRYNAICEILNNYQEDGRAFPADY